MYPWTTIAQASKASRTSQRLRTRTAEEMAKELAELRKTSAAETNFDGVLLSSEDRLAKGHVSRTLAEISTPEGTLELRRVWREIDSLMGPGKSVLQALTARYAELRIVSTNMSGYLKQMERTRGIGARRLLLDAMDRELAGFSRLKSSVVESADADARLLARELKAELTGEQLAKLGKLPVDEVRKEARAALDEFERALLDMRKAAEKGVDARPGTRALRKLAEEQVVTLKAGNATAARRVLSSRIKRLSEFGDPMELGPVLAKMVKKRVGRRRLPALNDIPDTSLMFMEALGAVAQARQEGARLLRRFTEGGAGALSAQELRKVDGYLGQLAGLLPEEIATRMKFLEGIFYKRAFETLDQFPPSLRGKMRVEMVEGPLSVVGPSGPPRQFGDGCMLVSGPRGQAALVGLGEFKAGFDPDLLTQLFVRSDGRAVSSKVRFVDADGNVQIRTLTREFDFGADRVALTQPPVYVYGRPGGEMPETAEKFRKMVDDQMRSGREMWKVQLPFSAEANRDFAEETLKEAVRILTQAKPAWGR